MEKLNLFVRLIAIVAGVVMIFFGLNYAITLFSQIYEGVINPASVAATIDQWALLLVRELDGMEHNAALGKVEHLRIMALTIIGVGGLLLTWLTIHIVVAGAKVVQIAVSATASARDCGHTAAPPQQEPDSADYAPLPPRQAAPRPAKP